MALSMSVSRHGAQPWGEFSLQLSFRFLDLEKSYKVWAGSSIENETGGNSLVRADSSDGRTGDLHGAN